MKKNTRIVKNIIMTFILLIIIILSIFTVYNYNVNNNTSKNDFNNQGFNVPPNMQENNNSNNQNTPPEKPSDDNNSNNQNTPPEKPSEENNTTSSESDSNTENKVPDMPNNSTSTTNLSVNNEQNNNNLIVYYVLFGTYGLLVSVIIIYLLMSKFNKKTLKETFKSSDKIIIYILSSLLLTTVLTSCEMLLSKTNFKSNSTNVISNNSNSSSISYTSSNEITSNTTLNNKEYASTKSNSNSLLITGDIKVNVSDTKITKTGDSDGGDNTSFYGINSALLAKDGATLTLKNLTVTTDATGANGIFSYGGSATTNNSNSDGTIINISDSKITTKKDNSGGIMVTGGGIINATNLTINTSGISSAAIRSDRGGGTLTVNKGTYKTTGQGSPAIYSTANITVKNAKLEATASEGVVIEGKNSVTLENVTLTDTNNKLNGKSTTYKNIFLYQSMSGDAADGNSVFTSKNSTITTNKGDTLYVTNTSSTINLTNNKIINNDKTGNFLRIQKDSWGNEGNNGGDVTLNVTNQIVNGNIVVDQISTLDILLKEKSSLEGAINSDNTAKKISLTLDKNSKIKLTSDSYVTSLTDEDTSYSNIDFNGYKLYVNGKAIN